MPTFNPKPEAQASALLKENKQILHNLYTNNYKNIAEALAMYDRYKIIQADLQRRGIECDKFKLSKNPQTRSLIMSLLGDKCCKCGSKYNLTLHHIKDKTCEDRDCIEFLELQCRLCHNVEHDIVEKVMRIENIVELQI